MFIYAPDVPAAAAPDVIVVVYSIPPSKVPSYVLENLNGWSKFEESDKSK